MKNECYYVAFLLDRTRYAIDSCKQTLENTEGAITKKLTKQGTQDDKTKKNITKTQYNMCWTPLCTNKHNNVNKT